MRAQSPSNITSSPSSPKLRTGMMARTASLGAFDRRKRSSRANVSKHGVPARVSSSIPGGQRYIDSARIRALSETIDVELTPLCRQLVLPRKSFTVKSGNMLEDNFPMVSSP